MESIPFVDYCEHDSAYAIGLMRARRLGLRITDLEGRDLTDEEIAEAMQDDLYSVQVEVKPPAPTSPSCARPGCIYFCPDAYTKRCPVFGK